MYSKPKPVNYKLTDWLPTSAKELELRGWESVDVILFSGDAYVDHPSFGAAVIGRMMEKQGLRVAIVPQPNWRDDLRDFRKLGRPALFFGVTSGSMDSMINHYTALLRKRSDDAYSPEGKAGNRPDYAATVYCRILKKLYPDVPVVLGGIEASLRRLTHYDYWSDSLKPSVLADSGADMLIYGMGEKPVTELITLLKKGVPFSSVKNLHQTAFVSEKIPKGNKEWRTITIVSHEESLKDKKEFAKSFKIIEEESNRRYSARIIQPTGNKNVIVNPPYPFLSQEEIDEPYDLPYTRLPHPRYMDKGDIPAYEMIRHSINIHRGCFGGCSFCTISAHQGKFVQSRSEESIMKELNAVIRMENFSGHITDLGGPSANMYRMQGIDQSICDTCRKPSCIYPVVCKNLDINHKPLLDLYRKARISDGLKKITIGSGIRYDLFLGKDGNPLNRMARDYFRDLVKHHVSGRMKVAPEHTDDEVLKIMRKPSFSQFIKLNEHFERINAEVGLNQQLIPYFISGHPGTTTESMAGLAVATKKLQFRLEQVQDFTPTPMTLSSVIYYSGIHPYTLKKVRTPLSREEKLLQRNFFFWYKKENKGMLISALKKIRRDDLITQLFGRKF
ncbi:MAG: YgiQ family radical SAM protein [Bacteroidia bacterium]|nr:YgiQ family radical SAM protein [Bacteroidia bacterium]